MILKTAKPLAITMWDFSWLERRWPGAGYEDWDQVLDELKDRGYDAVRIDAYPHLVAASAGKTWELLPCWDQQDWGSPARNRVQVQPALNRFIRACGRHGIQVALSTWFRQDPSEQRLKIRNPRAMAQIWKATLDSIAEAGLLKHILYVDLCNEFPVSGWAPFLYGNDTAPEASRRSPRLRAWMRESVALLQAAYPRLPLCYSFTTQFEGGPQEDLSGFGLLELHLWMAQRGGYYAKVGYNYERFSPTGYEAVVRNAEKVYRRRQSYWLGELSKGVQELAAWSKAAGKPLVTTECWAIVDYKDWPLLDWGWVKDVCAHGTLEASRTRRWAALATSNFCGPQFKGMWQDKAWHRRLTKAIHAGTCDV